MAETAGSEMIEQDIISGLVSRGIPEPVALGVVSRMRAESRLDPSINEQNPTVPGSRGGFGLNQWTGPRRVQLEKFAAQRGVPASDLNAQLDFTVWELQNTEKSAGDALMSAQTPDEAARIYMEKFLRPGIIHADMRGDKQPQNAIRQPQQETQPQNALAQPFRPQVAQLDASNFMRQRNALNPLPLQFERRNALGSL